MATLILAVLVTVWHVPTFFLEGGLQPSFILGGVLGTVAVTFWYSWLFNHTGGSVLMTLVAHATEGSIQFGAFWTAGAAARMGWLLYAAAWCAVAIGLVVFDWQFWRGPAPWWNPSGGRFSHTLIRALRYSQTRCIVAPYGSGW